MTTITESRQVRRARERAEAKAKAKQSQLGYIPSQQSGFAPDAGLNSKLDQDNYYWFQTSEFALSLGSKHKAKVGLRATRATEQDPATVELDFHCDIMDKDGDKEESMKDAAEDAKVEEGAFAPNHYCVHHGGVQHEGQIKMAEAVSHNFDSDLNKVTWYDMKLEDGTILEQVAAEDIQVTSASLAEMHHAHRVEDDEEDEMEEGKHDKGIGSKMSNDMRGDQYGMDKKMDIKGGRVTKPASQRLGKRRSLRGMKAMVQEKMPGTGKISVREAKEITRSIIERIRQENTDNE